MDRNTYMYRIGVWCILYLASSVHGLNYPNPDPKTPDEWFAAGQDELGEALKVKYNMNRAKNVIFFLGDGMSMNTVFSGRIYVGQSKYGQSGEEYQLAMEKLPHVGLAKTYLVDKQIPDSAGTATAFLCGVKANDATVGVNANVKRTNCSNSAENEVTSILDWSMAAGKSTGIVTTARITHASPAASYAHSAERNWENDAILNTTVRGVPGAYNLQFGCKDIARQLIEDNPDINVLMGGGRRNFRPTTRADDEYETSFGKREDNRDLIQEWKDDKDRRGVSNQYVWNKDQFDAVDPANTDYLLGLFEPSHMQYELDRDVQAEPSIADMTRKAIEILQKNYNGYFLFVVGGRIDHAHHDGNAKRALEDLYAFDEAVRVAKEMTNDEDTLLIVTSDHSHAFTTQGYTSRGLDILGFGDGWDVEPPTDGMPFTTLGYTNGPGAIPFQPRQNLTGVDTKHNEYLQQAVVPMSWETHGGEDVPIYASGPMAHLFHKTHEQNYIAHVMAYASCVGDNRGHCDSKEIESASAGMVSFSSLVLFTCVLMQLLC